MGQDSNMLDLAQTVFSGLVLVISAGVTAHIFYGFGNKKWHTSFIGLLLLMLVGTQVYYLVQAVLYIPTYPYQYDKDLLRFDCLDSGKGGKRSRSSTEHFDLNPCFNQSNVSYEVYLSYERNCEGGLGGMCTEQEPCDPCDRDSLPLWNPAGGGRGRCRSCTASFRGDCQFVPGLGPYCREFPNSKIVIPCKRCCTDSAPLFINGTCY